MRVFPPLLAFFALLAACGSSPTAPSDPAKDTYADTLHVDLSQMTKVTPDLYILDKTVGTGATAANGLTVGVTYTGYFTNGTKFDSNVGGTPLTFPLGYGAVIDGWDKGLVGMKVGGTRRLIIGSAMAYGSSGYQGIPPNTTLVFDVQLLSAK